MQETVNDIRSSSDLDCLKNNVVTQMFIDPADQNYVVARWAYHNGLFLDYFWNACQAIEKYLKGSLLLNEECLLRNNGKNRYGHNLCNLFSAVQRYADDLFPGELEKPEKIDELIEGLHWRDETPATFIARLNDLGDPNNRYNLFGYNKRWEDLCHLDQFVFSARRVAFNLEAYPFLGRPRHLPGVPQTVRESLLRSPNHQIRGSSSRFEKLAEEGTDEVRYAALNFNFPFAPQDHQHDFVPFSVGGATSVLYRRIVQPSSQNGLPSGDRTAVSLADWVIASMPLPANVRNQLKEARDVLHDRC